LEIDITALLKSTSDLKKEIDALKNTQKDLAASGDKSSEAFVQNEAVLKSLNSAYASNVKVIQESGQATKTQADQAQLVTMALSAQISSWMTKDYLEEKAQQGSWEKFQQALAKVSDGEPEEYDKM
jgi:predicted  nucleic acid-binding Zn-ribbon protein